MGANAGEALIFVSWNKAKKGEKMTKLPSYYKYITFYDETIKAWGEKKWQTMKQSQQDHVFALSSTIISKIGVKNFTLNHIHKIKILIMADDNPSQQNW